MIRLHDALERCNAGPQRKYTLSMSVGTVNYDPEHPASLDELISGADARMYEEKQGRHGRQ
jgi:GGDEF domain-containing protein